MRRVAFLLICLTISTTLGQTDKAFSIRSMSGFGYVTSIDEKKGGFGYHIGGRFLLDTNPQQRYGLELTYISPLSFDDQWKNERYVSIGIVLEQTKFGWFNMSIGTIGYVNIDEKNRNPFGIVSDLGWESHSAGVLKPFVTYRSEWIFDNPILSRNSISFGLTF